MPSSHHITLTEDWARGADILTLLIHMLIYPTADLSDAVYSILKGDHLHVVHSISLLRASTIPDFKQKRYADSFTRNRAVAYQLWF